MSKQQNPYKYYDAESPLLSTLDVKKRKDYKKSQYAALVLCVIGMVIIAGLLVGYNKLNKMVKYSPVKGLMAVSAPPSKTKTKIINVPDKEPPPPVLNVANMYLSIPKLLINTPIEEKSSSVNDEIATPSDSVNISWYKNGKAPGEVGNAILSGFTSGGSTNGILTGLDRLKSNDEIKVIFKNNSSVSYKIIDIKRFKQGEEIPVDLLKKEDGKYLSLFAVSGSGVTPINAGRDRMLILAKAD